MPKVMKEMLKQSVNRKPLWEGPNGDGLNGGITQSMLSRFLVCRERFRLSYVEGWREADRFNHRSSYGDMWHVCEEALAGAVAEGMKVDKGYWERVLEGHCSNLLKKYPLQQRDVEHWYNVCRLQFPLYVDHWSKHPDVQNRTPLLQEQVFDVPYKLPSGRTVRLRGKWDSVDLVGKGKTAGIWLQENKTKGDIDEQLIRKQLLMDLQVMFYVTALQERVGHQDL